MNALDKLKLLKGIYNKEKEERGINNTPVDEKSSTFKVETVSISDKIKTSNGFSVKSLEIDDDIIESIYENKKLKRPVKDSVIKDKSEEFFNNLIVSIDVIDILNYNYLDSLENLKNTFMKFIQSDFDVLTDWQCVSIIKHLIDKINLLNNNNYPKCSLERSSQLVTDELSRDVEESADSYDDFFQLFIDTYTKEETKVYDENKMEYHKEGKLKEFKQFQLAKMTNMVTILEWILYSEE